MEFIFIQTKKMNQSLDSTSEHDETPPSTADPRLNTKNMGIGPVPRTPNTMENYLLATGGKPPSDLTSLGWIKQLDFYKPIVDDRVLWEIKIISNNSFPDALACLPAQAIQRGDRSQEFF